MEDNLIPNHIAIIPDGNRRWAKENDADPWDGHEEGAKKIEELIKTSLDLGIKNMSFWGSSLGNLEKRPIKEKKALLDIYGRYFSKLMDSKDIHENKVKINIIGRWEEYFPEGLKKILKKGIQKTENYKNFNLNFFLAYSGDDDMIESIKKIVEKFNDKSKITGDVIKENLMTRSLPSVDYMIRTGGEPHLSAGFLMWDTANAQLYFSDKFFPDFGAKDLEVAIEEYRRRGRRLGK